MCGCTWQLMNLLPQSTKTVSPTFPAFICVCTWTCCSVCYVFSSLAYSQRIEVHLDAVRRFLPSFQIAEILSGLKISASVPKMSSYTCNIASTDTTKSWLKTAWKKSHFTYLPPLLAHTHSWRRNNLVWHKPPKSIKGIPWQKYGYCNAFQLFCTKWTSSSSAFPIFPGEFRYSSGGLIF